MHSFKPIETTVYHYCSLETFYNIISSKKLRLSNVKFFRDSLEQKHFITFLRDYIKGRRGDFYKFLRAVLTDIEKRTPPPFALCCSLDPQSLTQWKSYGDDCTGVAIGINPKFLRGDPDKVGSRTLFRKGLRVFPVFYTDERAESIADQLIEKFMKDFEEVMPDKEAFAKPREITVPPKTMDVLTLQVSVYIANYSSLCKDSQFASENEARIIYRPDSNHGNKRVPAPQRIIWEPAKYCYSRGQIITYHEIDIEDKDRGTHKNPKKEPFINEVWLGTHCKAQEEDIKTFLSSNNMLGQNPKIKRFKSSYI